MAFIWILIIAKYSKNKNIYYTLSTGFLLFFLGFYSDTLDEVFEETVSLYVENYGMLLGMVLITFGLYNWTKSLITMNTNLSFHLSLVTDNAQEGLFVLREGKIIEVNRKLLEILGYSEEELIGSSPDRFIHPDDLDEFGNAKKDTGFKTLRIIDKKGDTKWIQANSVSINLEDRDAKLCFIQDIDEKKKLKENKFELEMKKKESEERYRKVVETANDAIFIADIETGLILDANRKAETLLGLPKEKIIGMHHSELHPKR